MARRERMLLHLVIALTLVAGLLFIPAAADAAEPWLDEAFDSNPAAVFDGGWGVNGTSKGHVGNGVVSNIPAGNHWGSSAHWYTDLHIGHEPEEMWMRYYLKFPDGFRIDAPYRGKLPGFGGLYTYNCLGGRPSAAHAPCWSARMSMSPLYLQDGLPTEPVDADKVTRIGWYAYLLNDSSAGQDGKILNWDPDLSTLDHGTWYCIEGRVAMNTPGVSDGVLEGYVDGQQAFAANDLRFRRSSESHLKVKSLWWDIYYGGSGTSPINNEIYFDSLAIGPERLGCSDSPAFSGTFFDDDGSTFEADIEKLAASGITKGCNPPTNDRYCPNDSVTRGQMAAFLERALGDDIPVDLPSPPASPPDFWGGDTGRYYKDALDDLNDAGVPWDSLVLTFTFDERNNARDWLRTGLVDNPNQWVPQQLDAVWNRGATPYIKLQLLDLAAFNRGDADQRLENMLNTFKGWLDDAPGRRMILDVLPNANDHNSPHGDDPTGFKQGFETIASEARSKLGNDVRIAFTQRDEMRSNRFSKVTYGYGGFGLYWPGADLVDLAGISHYADGTTNALEDSLDEFVRSVGSTTPLFISFTGSASSPNEAAQMAYITDLVDLVGSHPLIMGAQWEDDIVNGIDYRVTTDSGVDAGYPAAVADSSTGGLDWLFSNAAKTWRSAREDLSPFTDTAGNTFETSIMWLAASGITKGCNPSEGNTRFCPHSQVTRGQMAAFLTRALSLPPAPASVGFSDTNGHTFEADIARLAHAGITKGCNPSEGNTKFCPNAPVTRGQMAAFLVRAGLTS